MKANQLIAGVVIAAGLVFGTAAQAQGLGGLGGHIGGALGGGAGGGMAGFNGMGAMSGMANGNTLGANADGFSRATRTHGQDDTAGTGTAKPTKNQPGHSMTSGVDTGASAAGAGKPTAVTTGSTATSATSSPASSAVKSSSTATTPSTSQPAASQRGAQIAGGTNASKGGIDADASGQGTASRSELSANGGVITNASAGR